MTISVIIPTLNEERVIRHTLTHTGRLGFEELIVVDGGSRDRTREIAKEFEARGSTFEVEGRRSEVERRTTPCTLLTAPAGRASQMNAGAAASQGEVVLFLHADTRLPLDAKSSIEQALTRPDVVGGRFDLRFDRDAGLGRLIGRMINLRSRWTGIATGDQAIFVRRATFQQVGGFANIPIMEDVDLTRRLKHAGRTACLRSQVVTSYRRWDTRGPIRTIALMWLLRFLYWLGVSPTRLSHLYGTVR